MEADRASAEQLEPKNLNNKKVPDELLVLDAEQDSTEVAGILRAGVASPDVEGNLFGKFFNNRASFFIIESPTNKIHNSGVKSITMYYLDGKLSQAKYVLERNVLDSLVQQYGRFRIKAFDPKNREILASGAVLVETEEGLVMNDQLDNFEMRWALGDMQIKYRVNLKEGKEPFLYTERLESYEKNFRRVERGGI